MEEDPKTRLLREQAAFFRQGGVSLSKANEMGVGFLYDEDGGPGNHVKEREEEEEEHPEDVIPDLPENRAAREFLRKAPRTGLYMPLGKEVKVMQCWRCKQYGHRTGDRDCPFFLSGNLSSDAARQAREDPMAAIMGQKMLQAEVKNARRAELERLIQDIRQEVKEKKAKKREKKRKKEGKRKKKRDKKEGKDKEARDRDRKHRKRSRVHSPPTKRRRRSESRSSSRCSGASLKSSPEEYAKTGDTNNDKSPPPKIATRLMKAGE